MNNNQGLLDIISGNKPVRINIGIDYLSAAMLAAALFVVGLILIVIGKKL